MSTAIKTDMGCLSCGFTTNDSVELRLHPCGIEIDYKVNALFRAKVKEAKAEARRNRAEEKIQEIIGEKWETFIELRNLFTEWEAAEEEMENATERITRLDQDN